MTTMRTTISEPTPIDAMSNTVSVLLPRLVFSVSGSVVGCESVGEEGSVEDGEELSVVGCESVGEEGSVEDGEEL